MTQSNEETLIKPSPRVLGGTIESVRRTKQTSRKQHDKGIIESKTRASVILGDQIKEVKKSLITGKAAISMMMDRKLQKTLQDIGTKKHHTREPQKSGSNPISKLPKPTQEQNVKKMKDKKSDTEEAEMRESGIEAKVQLEEIETEEAKEKAEALEIGIEEIKIEKAEEESRFEEEAKMKEDVVIESEKEEVEPDEVILDDSESIITFVSAVDTQSLKAFPFDSNQEENDEEKELDLAIAELDQYDQINLSSASSTQPNKAQNLPSLAKDINPLPSHPGFTSETWNAIFHPLSTFKHKKGELAYYPWNSTNLPAAAVQVAQRVNCPLAYGSVIPNIANTAVENATLPQVMPTPHLGASPKLVKDREPVETESIIQQDSVPSNDSVQLNENKAEDGRYFSMLQEIRGGNRYSTASMESQSTFKPTKKFEGATKWRVNPPKPDAAKINEFLKSLNLRAIGIPDKIEKSLYNKGEQQTIDPELLAIEEARVYTIKRVFWLGFICPFLWVFGSFYLRMSSQTHIDPNVLLWQKRCRFALVYVSLALAGIILFVSINATGAAAVRQTQTDTIRTVISG
ncbi:hypothetical protein A0J61_00291 [Choanephora cucurbitarum]|uniref:Uncharacterized protein n=1 Tax=Choanephora cucurbitarum TaxID=101091 RepID=A0A1C7NRB2_9FUNG|nr:hypothetical protein A0J61_00291 [Choanephora cucurbitarum]